MKANLLLTALLLAMSLMVQGKNTKTTVTQVTTTVTVSGETDYIINGNEPFDGDGLVNITDKEHAVLIVERVKPSLTISTLLPSRVQINGEQARNGVNCQVRLYGTRGSMILPYATADKPLTVYSGQNFTGEQCSDFGLENDGGYMVTMSDAKLNNRIRSFRLKRGYMVTFATGKSGYGYQRCFIANDQDIEMATLPQILDNKISSYRVFKWNTAGKKGLASNTSASDVAAVGAISCYGWDTGHDMQPDVECVPNHLYEDYPSSKACGSVTWSCHMKTNNEPRNSSDDKPQSLNTILNNWQNLMRTGLRLCSPSSWDGSDYTDGSGFLKQFFDSIDARGWRCDLADLHCYWEIGNFNNLGTMQSKYKRPLWISEWFWGSSWGKNGAFASGNDDGDVAWAVQQICEKLNSYGYVERYFYWNSESKGKLISGGKLTQAGNYYSNMLSGMGYNSAYEKIPNMPRMRGGFRDFHVSTDEDGRATISWHDYDGEYNQLMEVLRKEPLGAWQTWKTIQPDDAEADYTVVDDQWTEGVRYRLHIKSFSGRDYYSSQDMEPGEGIEMSDGSLRYVGGNIIPNGQFRMGLYGWTSGTGHPLGQPWFEVFPKSITDGYFLQAFANHGKDGEGSLKTAFDIVPQQDYVLRLASQNAGSYMKLETRMKGESADANKLTMQNTTYWTTQQGIFNSGTHNEALLAFRWLAATGQIGDIELCRLFTTRDEAISDGVEQALKRAQAVVLWNTILPQLNTELQQRLTALPDDNEAALTQIERAIDATLQAIDDKLAIDSLLLVAQAVDTLEFYGQEALREAVALVSPALGSATPSADLAHARRQLETALDNFFDMSEAKTQPQSASFSNADGWETKVGTYIGGDQRTATQQDKTCWNAWWSGISASEGDKQTMEIRQKMGGLAEGLYALQCKASTQHYCLSDQHGYLTNGSEQAVTPQLTRDYLDIPNTISAWQTLTTTPIYISETDSLTIGFIGTKQGTTDNAWRRYGNTESDNTGDKREGWWCATDFKLLYHPAFRFDYTSCPWGTICLPYSYRIPQGAKLYRIAGLLSDYSRICLEEVDEAEQGRPYILFTEKPQLTYYAFGKAVDTPVSTDNNNLTGTFQSAGKVIEGRYFLADDGEWYRATLSNRPQNVKYTAVIRRCSGMPILESWNGQTMVIHGVSDELGDPSGISTVPTTKDADSYYTIGGRPANKKPAGLHIQVEGQQARKVIGTK